MRRTAAILGSGIFLIVAPGTLAGYLPWTITRWHVLPPLLGHPTTHFLGAGFIAVGGPMLLECFVRFALRGRGTPAPLAPPVHLVITGLYRHVRNPMYVAVTLLIVGQGLWFANRALLLYAAFIWLMFHIFVLAYEEPTLRSSFPEDFKQYRANVPRWIPRIRPWNGLSTS